MKLFEFGRVEPPPKLRVGKKSKTRPWFPCSNSTIWSGRMLNLEIWPPQTSVLLSLNISILYVFFAYMNLQISEAVKPKGDRDSVTFIFLQRLNQRFDNALDEADDGTSSDDCPMISEQKRGGGVGMLVRVN